MLLTAASNAREWPSWWDLTWPGWVGVAAIAQGLAAFGTLAALIFLWRQVAEVRRQTRDQAAAQALQIELSRRQLATANRQAWSVRQFERLTNTAFVAACFNGAIILGTAGVAIHWALLPRGAKIRRWLG